MKISYLGRNIAQTLCFSQIARIQSFSQIRIGPANTPMNLSDPTQNGPFIENI